MPKLSGFCLLMKRAVYHKIGGLDEPFGLGFFDDDLAERARRAGFELALAHDLFVHHFGSRTFVGNRIDAGRLLDENSRRFADKWRNAIPQGRRVALRPFRVGHDRMSRQGAKTQGTAEGVPSKTSNGSVPAPLAPLRLCERTSPDLNRARPRLSLTVIARDEENNLPHCLESVRGLFDEIVIVDHDGS